MKKTILSIFALATFVTTVNAQCSIVNVRIEKKDLQCPGRIDGLVKAQIPTSSLAALTSVNARLLNSSGVQVGSSIQVPFTGPNAGVVEFTSLVSGTYRLSLDAVCPSGTTTLNRTVILSPAVNFTVTLDDKTVCTSSSIFTRLLPIINGRAITNVNYKWSNGSSNIAIGVSQPGSYTITVSDNAGCLATATSKVTALAAPMINEQVTPDVCSTKSGSIIISASSGQGPYSFAWSNLNNTDRASNLASGGYTVTITDANGCQNQKNIEIPASIDCRRVISGKVVEDVNSNCTADATEAGLANYRVQLRLGNGLTRFLTTNSTGNYSFELRDADVGPFSISLISPNRNCFGLLPTCNNNHTFNLALGQSAPNRNFYLGASTFKDVLCQVACGAAISGRSQTVTVSTLNNSCVTVTGSLRLNNTGTPIAFTLAPGQRKQHNLVTQVTVAAGAMKINRAVLTIDGGDDVSSNDQEVCQTMAVNPPPPQSYDPNYELVNPIRDASNNGIFATDVDLNYIVNFQNIGDGVCSIVRTENELDPAKYDLSTIEFLGASHENNSFELDGNKIVIRFPNINLLPQIVDEELSKGWFAFRVKRLASLPIGTIIENAAAIYFDYNDPVVTNYGTSTIIEPLSNEIATAEKASFSIMPNPTASSAKLKVNLANDLDLQVQVYTINGELVSNIGSQFLEKGLHFINLDLANQATGTYFVRVQSAEGSQVLKLVKQ